MPDVNPLEFLFVIAICAVFVLAVYAAIVLVARVLHRTLPATTPPRDPALDALRTRFANGTIDEVEFERLRSVLQRR
jgi:uncharacterized membrane protein